MAQIIALANQKGGVSKTTSAINLGAALAELNRRVLLVDLDPQASLTAALGINPAELPASIHDVLVHKTPLPEIIVTSAGLHVAPATIDLAAAEIHLLNEIGREQVLAEALADVTETFDDILIDCPPSLGQLTINALTAADATLVPIECSYLALRGLDQLTDTIAKIRRRSNPQLRFLGVLPTMFEGRTIHEREVLEDLRRRFPDHVYDPIPRSVRFRDSTLAGVPLLTYDSSNPGAAAYRTLAQKVM
jgi:chromosome partitioning protein